MSWWWRKWQWQWRPVTCFHVPRYDVTFILFTSAKIASRSGYFELTAPVNPTANGCAASPNAPAWRPYMAASTPKGIQWCGTPERVVKSRCCVSQVRAATAPRFLAHRSFTAASPTISRVVAAYLQWVGARAR